MAWRKVDGQFDPFICTSRINAIAASLFRSAPGTIILLDPACGLPRIAVRRAMPLHHSRLGKYTSRENRPLPLLQTSSSYRSTSQDRARTEANLASDPLH